MKPKAAGKHFAKKSFGQNFLIDQTYIHKIVDALNLQSDDIVVEIGPGRGALTEELVRTAANVIAVELDRDLIRLLKENFSDSSNFQLIEADALEIDFSDLGADSDSAMKLVANLPYYISTAILQRLIDYRGVFSEMVLMLQREVVRRITALAGNSERGFLTVLMEAYFECERLFDVPPAAFSPEPKVWSSVIRLKPKSTVVADDTAFRKLISEAFGQKRKTILNNLKRYHSNAAAILEQSGIESGRRPESLLLNEWLELAAHLRNDG